MTDPGFNWVTPVLCVDNMAISLKHYEQALGFDVAWAWSESQAFESPDEPTFACVCRGEISLFLCEQGQGTPGAWICLNVATLEGLDDLHEQYQRSGARIIHAPEDKPWGMREMLVQDLDGNTFRMGCMLESG